MNAYSDFRRVTQFNVPVRQVIVKRGTYRNFLA